MKITTIIILALLVTTIAHANVWRVNNNATNIGTPACDHCFDDLQDAINSASVAPGDTIHVEASTVNYGSITIAKEIVLIGAGFFLADNDNEQATQLESRVRSIDFLAGSDGSVVNGMSFSVVNNDPLTFASGISDITITRSYLLGSISLGSVALNNITIKANYIKGSVTNANNSSQTITNLKISNNYIQGNLGLYNSTVGICTHNVIKGTINIQSGISEFYNNICIRATFPMGQYDNSGTNVHHNIYVGLAPEPNFLESGENHFGLGLSAIFPTDESLEDIITTLPFCDECQTGFVAGQANEGLMGIYGGLQPYRRAGIPPIVSIYLLQGSNEAYQGGTINVEVSAKSNQ